MLAGFSLSIWKVFSFRGRLQIAPRRPRMVQLTNAIQRRDDMAHGIKVEQIAELATRESERNRILVDFLKLLEFYAVFFQ